MRRSKQPKKKEKKVETIWKKVTFKFQRLPDILKWIGSLITAIIAIVISYNQLSSTLTPIIKKYFNPLPPKLVVYVCPDPFKAKSYLSILASNGIEVKYIDPSQIDDLKSLKPGAIVFASGKGFGVESLNLSQSLQDYLKGNIKIIGMGMFGADVFQLLSPNSPLGIGQTASGKNNLIYIDSRASQNIIEGVPLDQPVAICDSSIQGTAVYDEGSLPIMGVQAVARWSMSRQCIGSYWPIAIHGNHALWGYDTDANHLTEIGRTLFLNLVKHTLESPYEIPELDRQYYKLGTYRGTLGCDFTVNNYPFRINQVGDIQLRLLSNEKLVVVLSGPGQAEKYARVDGISPELIYTVTESELSRGSDWTARISYHGAIIPETRIDYELQISYSFKQTNKLLWYIIGLLGICLLIFVTLRILGILKKRERSKVVRK